jgi:hypothetical protein
MAIGARHARAVLAPALFTGVLVLLSGLAGCGSGGSKAPAATITPAATATPSPLQSWQQALGAGVTVTEPATPAPGLGSPGAAAHGALTVLTAAGCRYYQPSAQAECRRLIAEVPGGSIGTATGFRLGYVAVDGDRAIVGFTGTECLPGQHPRCYTNRDPAAIFSTAQSFATLWTESVASVNVFIYSLTPCVRIGGRWYAYLPTGPSPNIV